MAALTDKQFQEVARIVRVNGATPKVIKGLATQYKIDESYSARVVTALDAANRAASKMITESGDAGTPPGSTDRQARLAEELRDAVNRAEAKEPSQWTHQDMEALAAARFG